MGISTCMSVPLAPKPHGEVLMDPDGCLHAVGCITEKNPKSFIVDNKHVYPWFQGGGTISVFQQYLLHVVSCSVLSNSCSPIDWSPPGSSVYGIFQARILDQVAISSFRGSSWPRDGTRVSCISCMAGGFFTTGATWEAPFASCMPLNR